MPLIHSDTYTVGMLPPVKSFTRLPHYCNSCGLGMGTRNTDWETTLNFLKSIYVYIEADTAIHLQQVEPHQQMLLSVLGKLLILCWLSHNEFWHLA